MIQPVCAVQHRREEKVLQKGRILLFSALIIAMLVSCEIPPANPVKSNPDVKQVTPASLSELPQPSIARHPEPAVYKWNNAYTVLPKYNPNSTNSFQIDLRSSYLVKLDLTKNLTELLHSDFDSLTKWPPADKLPSGFDIQKITEWGKDPGLGIRFLHEKGITGTGVGIAIIDQPMLVDHQEYVHQLELYEEIYIESGTESQMHGPAVASIAVGKTVGVAPGADLYFIANWSGTWKGGTFEYDFSYLAQAVRRILEINKMLPDDRKIRVISMSIGWTSDQKGYADITAAVNEAKAAGIFVVSTSISEIYGLNFHGLGRPPLSDPNDFQSYDPGSWWQSEFYKKGLVSNTLLVPMDTRATASPTGIEDYAFYSSGGWSWCVPYLAGMYALAWQVKPGITPEEFWATALQTGQTIKVQHGLKSYSLGVILDPQALIAELQK
jgi:hypothetical protein